MSTAPTPPAPAPVATSSLPREVRVYAHSALFYWWPVWFFGIVFGLWSYFDGDRMAIIPSGSIVRETNSVANPDGSVTQTVVIEVAGNAAQSRLMADAQKGDVDKTWSVKPRVTSNAAIGPMFLIIITLVVIITNVPLRGLWSLIVVVGLIAMSLIFSLLKVWDDLVRNFSALHIYMNMSGYFFLAVTIGITWVVSVFIFDRRTYMIFTPGQVKVCEEVGGREKVYDTMGISLEKQRADWFRHYILGFGTGDLIVRTAGADRHEITMNNVLMINFKIQQIERMTRERQTRAVS
jgi:hypothetical protein